jgi:outer membrane biogenesis lipoprotein LolB
MKNRLLALILLGLSSCATHGPIRAFKARPISEVWDLMWKNQEGKRSETTFLKAKIRLEMVEKKRSLSGNGMVLIQPEGLRLELRDPLGRTQYTAALQGKNKFLAFYPSQNLAYADKAQGARYLKEFLGLGMNFYELKDLWLGLLPFEKGKAQMEKVTSLEEEGQYQVSFRSGELRAEAWVDSETCDLMKLKWQVPGFVVSFEFSDFESCCQDPKTHHSLPRIARNVLLKTGNSSHEMDLEWEEISAIKKMGNETFELELPAQVKPIWLN